MNYVLNLRFDLKIEIKIKVSLWIINKMREPLFRATTEHAKWHQKERYERINDDIHD